MPSIIKEIIIEQYINLLNNFIKKFGISGDRHCTTLLMLAAYGCILLDESEILKRIKNGVIIIQKSLFINKFKFIKRVMKALIKKYDIINRQDIYGYTALNYAIMSENIYKKDVIKLLIDKGIDININCNQGENILQFYIRETYFNDLDIDIIKMFINNGINLDHRNRLGQTVLHTTINNICKLGLIKLLVYSGANINKKDNEGNTILHNIARFRTGYLFSHDNENKQLDNDLVEIIKFLISEKINVNERNNNNATAICCTCSTKMIRLLIDNGADINMEHVNPLHNINDEETINYILNKGMDINKCGSMGYSLLHYSKKPRLQLLLKKGANINIQDNNGRTPLMTNFHEDVRELLLQHRANINIIDNDGNTVLHHLVKIPGTKVKPIIKLIELGLKTNTKNKMGQIPLHRVNSIDHIKYLTDNKENINTKDINGETPLHIALGLAGKNISLELIKYGADINAESNNILLNGMRTPIDLILKTYYENPYIEYFSTDILKYLLKKGCKKPYDYYEKYITQYKYRPNKFHKYKRNKKLQDELIKGLKYRNKKLYKSLIKKGFGYNIKINDQELIRERNISLKNHQNEMFKKSTLFVKCIVIINININSFNRKDILSLNKDVRKYFRAYLYPQSYTSTTYKYSPTEKIKEFKRKQFYDCYDSYSYKIYNTLGSEFELSTYASYQESTWNNTLEEGSAWDNTLEEGNGWDNILEDNAIEEGNGWDNILEDNVI